MKSLIRKKTEIVKLTKVKVAQCCAKISKMRPGCHD